MSLVLRVFVLGRAFDCARREPDFGVTSVAVDTAEVDLAVVHVFDAFVAIGAADTAAASFFGSHPPEFCPRAGWIAGCCCCLRRISGSRAGRSFNKLLIIVCRAFGIGEADKRVKTHRCEDDQQLDSALSRWSQQISLSSVRLSNQKPRYYRWASVRNKAARSRAFRSNMFVASTFAPARQTS